MTIIEYMRKKLMEYPKIEEFVSGEMHVDFTDSENGSCGLGSNGDSRISGNIRGDEVRQHNFVMWVVCPTFTDYNRLANSNFLLELGYWLDHLPEEDGITAEINGKVRTGRFKSARSSNAMGMQPMGETVNDGILYQIQIQAIYELKGR